MSGVRAPRHIAFIMDGNGRWASRRGFPRLRGHEQGAEVLRAVVEHCCAERIAEVTMFALSTENFQRRPKREVSGLMRLLCKFLVRERPTIERNDIRLRIIGRLHELPASVQETARESLALSAGNRGMILRLALNYGSRQEILDAVERLLDERAGSGEREALTEDDLRRCLYDPGMSDPDLLIRTAGEYRISNFLLWQLSYSELHFVDVPWPEFSVEHLAEAIAVFKSRNRKFGRVRGALISPRDGLA